MSNQRQHNNRLDGLQIASTQQGNLELGLYTSVRQVEILGVFRSSLFDFQNDFRSNIMNVEVCARGTSPVKIIL